jgi:hypothetical protein
MSEYKDHKEKTSIFGEDYHGRKENPIFFFLTRYFPKALVAVMQVAVAGNKQHNKDLDPIDIHWARGKSMDQLNTALRHIFDHGTLEDPRDTDGTYHLAKAAWRVLAELELLIEADMAKGPKAGIRDTSQKLPADAVQQNCHCGDRVFAWRPAVGGLPPRVIGTDGTLHTIEECHHV